MAQLAIKGHKSRGEEVIEILGILGGSNAFGHIGNNPCAIYYIDENYKNFITCSEAKKVCDCIIFTLEEFLEKFPYKVGDKVTLDKFPCTIKGMSWDCDDVIYYVQGVDFSKGVYSTDKDLQPYKEETMKKHRTQKEINEYLQNVCIKNAKDLIDIEETLNNDELELPNNVVINRNGICSEEFIKWYTLLQYPKTYAECCEVLKIPNDECYIDIDVPLDYNKSLSALTELLICRDAYWKIAGDEYQLGKPWEPDWLNVEQDKYVLFTHDNAICSNRYVLGHNILAFPTKEMRDAFYENFKELIENCKELL